jgi:hypothetical protein
MIALYRASISCPKGSRYIEALGLNIYPMGGGAAVLWSLPPFFKFKAPLSFAFSGAAVDMPEVLLRTRAEAAAGGEHNWNYKGICPNRA